MRTAPSLALAARSLRLDARSPFVHLLRTRYPQFQIRDLTGIIDGMRAVKSPAEVALIKRASELAGHGIMEAMRSAQAGAWEYQLDAAARYVFFAGGAQGEGYRSITGTGSNAYFGHYHRNDSQLAAGELVLMDYAPDYRYYTSDVARVFPVDGKFSEREKELYELVLKASDAAIEKVRVGANNHTDVHLTAKQILDDAGYGEYFIHGTGHFVGLEVHDAGNYDAPFKAGVVVTVEPGIYIPEEGIGIRIEDVVLVTEDGPVVLSRNIPRTVEDIETVMDK